ncbi:MAG: hypothetical protein ACREQX_11015, partial [Candidatus Binataceae bacterium]
HALGGGQPRQSVRGTTRVRSPAHDDGSPSLDVTETPDGRTLLYCRAGCIQRDVIEALQARGLWSASTATARPVRRWDWADHLEQSMPELPACCLRTPACEHWRAWEREYLIAHAMGNLRDAIAEITARHRLGGAETRDRGRDPLWRYHPVRHPGRDGGQHH